MNTKKKAHDSDGEAHLYSRRQIAEAFGVSPRTITEWVSQGCPVARRDVRRRAEYFLVATVFRWRLARDGHATWRALGFMNDPAPEFCPCCGQPAPWRAELVKKLKPLDPDIHL